MEIRRLQSTGGSSYSITLPKEWVMAHGIAKNEAIGLALQPDGTILITPNITGDRVRTAKRLTVSPGMDPSYLFRLMVSAYVMGYSILDIRAESRIPTEAREAVRRFTQTAIGPEIVEESESQITMRDLLNPTEMPFDKTVRRIHIISRSMHTDAIAALNAENDALLRDVVARDIEVDRLQWLVAHQYNIISREANLLTKMEMTQEDANFYFIASRTMERIGDHAVKIAAHAPALFGGKAKALRQQMNEAGALSVEVYDRSMEAWFRKNVELANATIDEVHRLAGMCDAITQKAVRSAAGQQLAVGYIAESIRRTGEYASNIAELVMDYLIHKV